MRRHLPRLARWAAGLCVLGLAALWIAIRWAEFPAESLAPTSVEGHRILDRHGRLLRETLGSADGRGRWRRLDAISPWVGEAFVAIEDRRFWRHGGVDPRGVARAAWANARAGRVVAGGSTLTQQVVKLIQPQPRTLVGKLREAVLAWRLERAVDKAVILEQYVNRVPFGHGAVGVEAAAQQYLGTSADRLSLAQSALLAGVPRSPSRNNPFTDPARATRRQRVVLDALRETGRITAAQHAEALAEPVMITRPARQFLAPHFTSWIVEQGPPAGVVQTTLDLDLQLEVVDAVETTVRGLSDRHVDHAAVVVLDNHTGGVLAWQGSADFFSAASGQVDMVVGRRQPGSTLKPFVYALGLESGFTDTSELPDFPLFFPTALGDYRPRNYDRTFHGWVTLRAALANSYNVPAVWMAHRVGVGRLLARLRRVGLHSLDRTAEYYGLGLALGNGEVQLVSLTNAYRALANEGRWRPWRWRPGPPGEGEQVIEAPAARLLTDILSDRIARAPAFGRHSALTLPFPAAAKTGTSTDFTDNWAVGYTPAVTVGVWVGNFDGRPMEGVSGVTGAGRLFNRVMRLAAARYPSGRGFSATGASVAGGPGPDASTPPAGARPEPRLRVIYPDAGDVFALDPDTPSRHARLRLRAEAPEGVTRLVWALDGEVIGETTPPHARWWTATPGRHRLRVWPDGMPNSLSDPVGFRVSD